MTISITFQQLLLLFSKSVHFVWWHATMSHSCLVFWGFLRLQRLHKNGVWSHEASGASKNHLRTRCAFPLILEAARPHKRILQSFQASYNLELPPIGFFFLRDKDKLQNISNYVCYILFLLCLGKEEGGVTHQQNQVRHFWHTEPKKVWHHWAR